MICLKKAYFAKYNKDTLRNAVLKIEKLKEDGATPIEYDIFVKINCSDEDVEKIFYEGTIIGFDSIADFGLGSISDNNGVWQCIELSGKTIKILIYTAGTSTILYYSVY